MSESRDCIFCKIAGGEMPVPLVYEDEWVVAFDDISPQAPVHTLVIPRRHIKDLDDEALNEEGGIELLGHLLKAAREVASIKGLCPEGYRLIENNGSNAGQTVLHLHIHVLGGEKFNEGLV